MQLSQNGLLRQCRKVLRTRDYKLYSLAQSSTISRVNFGPESGDGQNIDPSPETTPMDQPKMNKSFWSIVFANHNKHHETWAIIFNNQSPSLGKYLEVLLILSTVLFSASENRLMQIFAMFIGDSTQIAIPRFSDPCSLQQRGMLHNPTRSARSVRKS